MRPYIKRKAGEIDGAYTFMVTKSKAARLSLMRRQQTRYGRFLSITFDGESLTTAAGKAGLKMFHGGVSRMLKNPHYLRG